ncbi:hypothetical protein DFJ58DRAFT_847063 [Suillus subalutaceus]|uniref:uncharacterized protein n=1 Tax=Suillus subalutaceus TaxID=48586 RepID=UPI001B880A60|nr:uncharacterized protein DFJ58DRAFT_847063 [Suillus subalutaceus]KAG1836239.1 hypothetical protein DFJ58DRAFT_847063 [Suillus subalutaceus]
MANATSRTASATAPKKPPHGVPVNSGSELKSTPLAVGSASVSEHISTVGVNLKSRVEDQMYKPFIQASNLALDRLSKLNMPGLVCLKTHDNHKILFHQNDPKNITQKHQGEKSTHRPDVIIVSRTGAKKVQKQAEFKHNKIRTGLSKPPATYAAKAYDVPEAKKYMKYHRKTNDTTEPTGLTPLPGSGAATSSCQTSAVRGRSKRSGSLNKKKCSSSQALDGHSSKKLKVNNNGEEPPKPPKDPQDIHPIVQNGLYAAELFAAHIMRENVITYVVDDDMIYMLYFDWQDAIQCSGINFVQDLPRFMVLLLAIQRMPFGEWGHNPVFEPKDGSSSEVRVPDEDIGEVDLEFDLKSDKCTTHFSLRRCATTIFPVKSKKLSALVPSLPHHNPHNATDKLVVKLYWPEEERESEVEILRKFEDTFTAKIRRALGLKDAERGRRVLYIIVFRELDPITDLSDKEFLAAWWHIIVSPGHYALWGENVHHRDVSPSNLMVYKTLNGQERTGTVPFMALDLLTKEGIEGKVKHMYQHDAESFIWVLTWICLRYQEGKLLRQGRLLDEWLRVDAIQCRKEKNDFLMSDRHIKASPSHTRNWRVARSCLCPVGFFYLDDPDSGSDEGPTAKDHVSHPLTDAIVFERWLDQDIRHILSPELLDVHIESIL